MAFRRWYVAPGLAAAGLLGIAPVRVGAQGTLDPAFATAGILHPAFRHSDNQHRAVLVQPDGKIVAGGECPFGTRSAFAVARYNPDGSPDTTFGKDGVAVTPFGDTSAEVRAVELQGDGKILAAGTAQNKIAVVRYMPDGSLDTSWDGDGKVIMAASVQMAANSMLLVSGGKVMVGGVNYTSNSQFALVRFNVDGSLDTSFDGDGLVVTDFGGPATLYSLRQQPDGKFFAVGTVDLSGWHIAMARYSTTGVLDTTFDGDGKATDSRISLGFDVTFSINAEFPHSSRILVAGEDEGTNKLAVYAYEMNGTRDLTYGSGGTAGGFAAGSEACSIRLLSTPLGAPAGILVAGTELSNPVLAKYTLGGIPDTSFDGDGKVYTTISPSGGFAAEMMMADGKIVIAGIAYGPSGRDALVLRYNSNGTLDATFDGDGVRIHDVGGPQSTAGAMALQPDGKVIVAGSSYQGAANSDDFAVMRCNADGSIDNTFGTDGVRTIAVGTRSDFAHAVALQPDGKIVAAGETGTTLAPGLAVVRLNPDGTLDPTFDGDGIATSTSGFFGRPGYGVTVRPDGKIFVVGTIESFSGPSLAVFRYGANGTLEQTLTTQLGGTGAAGYAIALQPDNKIVAAGTCFTETDQRFACIRLLPDNSFDPAFDGDGQVVTRITGNGDAARAIRLRADGRILLAGASTDGPLAGFALARYLPNGALDASFDQDGMLRYGVPAGHLDGRGVALQPNGKIVVVGTQYATGADIALMRLQDDGSLDPSYGGDGFLTLDAGRGWDDTCGAIVIDAAGRALLCGEGGTWGYVARLTGDAETSDAPAGGASGAGLRLAAPSPNPTRNGAAISFHLTDPGTVALSVYDANGRLVRSLRSPARFEAGGHSVHWNGRDNAGVPVAGGVYFVCARRGNEIAQTRVTVLR